MIKRKKGLAISIEPILAVSGCQVFNLEGYLDYRNVMWFQKLILRSIEKGCHRMIFSLERLQCNPEDLIGCLLVFLKAARSLDGDLVVVGIEPKLWECFQLLGFALFFNIRKDIEQAIAFFKQGGPFPKIFRCAICKNWLETDRQGVIYCSGCHKAFSVNSNGEVLVGAEIDYDSKKN